MKGRAPGKLILSGEHAVVYGKPALAIAMDSYTTTTLSAQPLPFISFVSTDFFTEQHLTLADLEQFRENTRHKYRGFLGGELSISEVLTAPIGLAQFALSLLLEVAQSTFSQGVKIHMQSDIPIGCGMGSSAAVVVSIIYACMHYLKTVLPSDRILKLGLEAENMQHGYSSGLDLGVSLNGGCVYFKDKQITARRVPDVLMHLVNTGQPQTNTGECIARVGPHFKKSQMAEEFAGVTEAMDSALHKTDGSLDDFKRAIRENHQLLIRIGVVPEKVQHFIAEVERMGGAAKVCGAGSISGDNAGMVLIILEDPVVLQKLCARYRYSALPISMSTRGAYVV